MSEPYFENWYLTKASLRGGAENVLIFWPILSLAVLIALVLIKKCVW